MICAEILLIFQIFSKQLYEDFSAKIPAKSEPDYDGNLVDISADISAIFRQNFDMIFRL